MAEGSVRILVVEDDPAITFGLKTNLSFEGFRVEVVDSCAAAVARAAAEPPDLLVLDLMLPDGSGFHVMEELARQGYTGRILVLSARMAETDKVFALRMGADDYVTKPFSLAELLARIEALLRRGTLARPGPVAPPAPAVDESAAERQRFGACEIDMRARSLRVAGRPVVLTRLEFDLLAFFVQHAGEVLGRTLLLREVWGLTHDGSARTVDNVIAHLRTKIGEDADRPRHLLTLRGAGYRFVLQPEDRSG
jgi:DNA-binding response OmpR family regulator